MSSLSSVIVVKHPPLPTNTVVKLTPLQLSDFHPTINLPNSNTYQLIDVDRGDAYRNLTPAAALIQIVAAGRSPLTIDEGLAILTHYPDFLIKNHCFSLLASRHPGDKRVPALWINAAKHFNLGWCWEGNPHTWLGSASCSNRS